MKQKIIGVYQAGYTQIQLVAMEGIGGEFYYIPEEGSLPRIKIGVDYDTFAEVHEALLHEILEFLLSITYTRYESTHTINRGHDKYIFMFTHPQFTEVVKNASEFLCAVHKPLKKYWKKTKERR